MNCHCKNQECKCPVPGREWTPTEFVLTHDYNKLADNYRELFEQAEKLALALQRYYGHGMGFPAEMALESWQQYKKNLTGKE